MKRISLAALALVLLCSCGGANEQLTEAQLGMADAQLVTTDGRHYEGRVNVAWDWLGMLWRYEVTGGGGGDGPNRIQSVLLVDLPFLDVTAVVLLRVDLTEGELWVCVGTEGARLCWDRPIRVVKLTVPGEPI